ncbi:MAG: ATP-binding protein, partial [Lachnospiraceae bacterium]|nr:ATP-binding protein [Lachnospiraceae bacterium]
TNLLTNAIRHNPKGSQILLVQKKENLDKISVVIADNGEHISPELVAHLFEPFTMGDQSRNSKNGSGLGLSIAYKIMELHGWKLEYVDSYPGYEKAFRLEIKV